MQDVLICRILLNLHAFQYFLVFLKLVRSVVLHFDPRAIHWIPHTTSYLIEKNLLVMSAVDGSRTFLTSM